jgi:hypothetical protein
MAFRITPSLGPDLEDHALQNYWDLGFDTPTYALGTRVTGSDGHEYVYVQAAANLASAATGLSINETTWVATEDVSDPVWETPVASILEDEFFHARKVSLA